MFGLRLDRMMWIVFVIILGTFSFQVQSFGFDEKEDNDIPDRLIVMAPEYPGIVISPDEDEVSIDLRFGNEGRSDETIKVWIAEKPEDWKARIKTYQYAVKGVFVKSGDDKTHRISGNGQCFNGMEVDRHRYHRWGDSGFNRIVSLDGTTLTF